jgi:hypothetical protein
MCFHVWKPKLNLEPTNTGDFMKSISKVLAMAAATFAASFCFAVNPRIISVSQTMFPGGDLSLYSSNAQTELVKAAGEFCKSFGEKVAKISNVVIQIQADFEPSGNSALKATNHPQTNYSGLVNCQPASR